MRGQSSGEMLLAARFGKFVLIYFFKCMMYDNVQSPTTHFAILTSVNRIFLARQQIRQTIPHDEEDVQANGRWWYGIKNGRFTKCRE